MNGRSTVSLLAALVFLGTAFAGCLEAPSFLTSTDAEVTARENRDLADNAALAWNPEAVLVGVTTVETTAAHAAESQGHLEADPEVGNGRALLWLYAYQAPGAEESRVFRVDADGRVQVENTSMLPMDEIGEIDPVGAWSVDSDAAMQTARSDARFEDALKVGNVSVVSALGNHEGASNWALVVLSEKVFTVAIVSATTGELVLVEQVDVREFTMPAMPAYPSPYGFDPILHVEGEGDVGGSSHASEHPFEFAGGAQSAVLVVHMERALPTDGLVWTLFDSEGEEVESGRMGRLLGNGGEQSFEFELPGAGAYTLTFTYRSMALAPLGSVHYSFTLDSPGVEPEEE